MSVGANGQLRSQYLIGCRDGTGDAKRWVYHLHVATQRPRAATAEKYVPVPLEKYSEKRCVAQGIFKMVVSSAERGYYQVGSCDSCLIS